MDCGNGVRIRLVSCIGTVSRQVVRDDLCEETKPPSSETCLGRGPCFDPTWISESWSDVSEGPYMMPLSYQLVEMHYDE